MISEVYDALLEAGASEEKARKAAEAVAAYDQRFAVLETRMVELGGRVAPGQWMVGTTLCSRSGSSGSS
jgi:hypothetical protein